MTTKHQTTRPGALFTRAFAAAPRAVTAGLVLLLVSGLLQTGSAAAFATAIGRMSSSGVDNRTLLLLLAGAVALVGVALCSWGLRPVWGKIATAMTQGSVSQALEQAERSERADDPKATARWLEVAQTLGSMRHREALSAVPEYLAARIRGASGAVILALVAPWAAVVLAVGTVIYGRFFTAMLDDVLSSMADESEHAARASYARSLIFNRSVWGEFRVFDAHRWLLAYVASHSRLGRDQTARQRSHRTRAVVVTGTILMLLYFASFWWLTNAALQGSVSIASLVLAFQGALLLLDLGPIGDTAVLYRQAAQAEARVGAFPADTSADQPNAPQKGPDDGPVISLRSVSFTYPGAENPVLDIEHLEIGRGERVAVVGRNGAGKSTLLGVIAGYIRGYEGMVEVASELSIALQNPAHYPVTFRDNVELGRPSADIAHALEVLGLPPDWAGLEYNDELGSRSFDGKDLSGGEWQRVGLARAVAQRGGVLLLDEPSASLDPKAEADFFHIIMSHDRWDAVVVTTHHLPNVRFVDRIIVMDQGRVVATGTHAELMAADGLYADLYSTQASLYGVNVGG